MAPVVSERFAVLRSRYLLWFVLAMPFVVIVWRYSSGSLYYGEVIHSTGELSVRLLIVAMAATPLMLAMPARPLPRWLIRNRRYLGIASFAYAALHTIVYLDKTAMLPDILDDALAPEYLSGWVGLLLFAVLAATSNDASVRWLRRTWKTVHRFVYVAAALSLIHWLLVAFNPLPAALHAAILAGLEAYRLWKLRRIRANTA